MSQVTVRPAKPEELLDLQSLLYRHRGEFEQQDLTQAIVYVAEKDDAIVGLITGRLVWQIPTLLIDREANLPAHVKRKATYMLIRELDNFIGDRERNRTGIYFYFCVIKNRTMQHLAKAFGMLRVYKDFLVFGRDT
jgi:hypothetical protein